MLHVFAVANTVGFHRLLTHRSFKTKWWIRNLLGLLGAQYSGSPMMWVGVHRVHHTISDWRDDLHSPRYYGFWWARCGWLAGTKNPFGAALFAGQVTAAWFIAGPRPRVSCPERLETSTKLRP